MKAALPNLARISGLALGALILTLAGCSKKAPAQAPAAKAKTSAATNSVAAVTSTNVSEQYASVFEDLPAPHGRDPFFPGSARRAVVAAATAPDPVAQVDATLVLKAILHTRTRSQAVVGSTILEKGEEESVHVPYGRVRVRCLDIGADYVVVQVAGESGPKRLMMEQKK